MKISKDKLLHNLIVDSRQQCALYFKNRNEIIEQYCNCDPNTNFRMASVAKQFITFSVLCLAESGAVNINTKLYIIVARLVEQTQ